MNRPSMVICRRKSETKSFYLSAAKFDSRGQRYLDSLDESSYCVRPKEAEVSQAAGPQYLRFSSRCMHVIASVLALSKDEASIPWAKTDIRSH
jgi:hypothetical protein